MNDEDVLVATGVFVVSAAAGTYNFVCIVTRPDADLPANWAWGVGFGACALVAFIFMMIGLVRMATGR